MANVATHHADTAQDYGWLSGLTAGLRQRWADHQRYRVTLRELDSLSDRELSDLGLSRHSIADVARESVYGA